MTLQDIHKEFEDFIPDDIDILFNGKRQALCSRQAIICFYDNKITELIKECIPNRRKLLGSIEENDIWRKGYNSCREQIIENLKARNINLD